jgi:hypothetical protein
VVDANRLITSIDGLKLASPMVSVCTTSGCRAAGLAAQPTRSKPTNDRAGTARATKSAHGIAK